MIKILVGVAALAWGVRTCYLGFRREEAPELFFPDDPKLAKSAHRIYGIGLILCGLIALLAEIYPRWP
jgi:hypothetical protein